MITDNSEKDKAHALEFMFTAICLAKEINVQILIIHKHALVGQFGASMTFQAGHRSDVSH